MPSRSRTVPVMLALLLIAWPGGASPQIAMDGIDLGSLTELRWGMPLAEVQALIGEELTGSDDDAFVYETTVEGASSRVTLTFDSGAGLRVVTVNPVSVDDEYVSRMARVARSAFGEPASVEERTERRGVIRVNMRLTRWQPEGQTVVLTEIMRGDKALGMALTYAAREE
jgi:hypothetical protein